MIKQICFLILCCALTVTVNAQSPPAVNPLQIGKKAPVLEFKDMDGKPVSLEYLKGNVIVLNFWNIGCKGCEKERETLNWLSDSLKGQPIKFVSITLNSKEKMTDWLAKHPINYEFVGNVDFMGIAGPSFFNYRCMPTTVVIDHNGVVQYNQCGPIIGKENGNKFANLLTKWQ
ncbi:MAG: TlpA family protein disulfide reductase [Bacteroidetes bacterium]|nr:TlpA family protein disulfide reductase [Fibrella sp.]